jgi:hypothetical protein
LNFEQPVGVLLFANCYIRQQSLPNPCDMRWVVGVLFLHLFHSVLGVHAVAEHLVTGIGFLGNRRIGVKLFLRRRSACGTMRRLGIDSDSDIIPKFPAVGIGLALKSRPAASTECDCEYCECWSDFHDFTSVFRLSSCALSQSSVRLIWASHSAIVRSIDSVFRRLHSRQMASPATVKE